MTSLSGLPEYCYVIVEGGEEGERVAKVVRGEPGYTPFPPLDKGEPMSILDAKVTALNKELGVSAAQAAAMKVGSMFGWHVPGANPTIHEPKNGQP